MARRGRIIIPNTPHHVVNRGNRRQDVFFEEDDYIQYLEILAKFCIIYEVRIVSYCLMTNHIHLIAIPSEEYTLAKAIGDAHQAYTRMINFRYGWRGHLWQGRFFSCPMDEIYTARTARYIELNPVKAKMVKDFGDYKYSSAGFHLGKHLNDPVIKEPYIDFSAEEWREYVEEGIDEEEEGKIEVQTQTGKPLGEEGFISKIEKLTGLELTAKKPGPKPQSRI